MGRNKKYCRADLLQKSLEVFWNKGFESTSLSDLERNTGVNKSGIYNEFQDKEDLFVQALQYFVETDQSFEVLYKEPLGWKNIEAHLKHGISKEGKKGSFCVNTVRDIESLPKSARNILNTRGQKIKDQIILNLKATGTKKDIIFLTNLIVTFYYGINLRIHTEEVSKLSKEVDQFLDFCKE